jgi:cytochrome c peroxidase
MRLPAIVLLVLAVPALAGGAVAASWSGPYLPAGIAPPPVPVDNPLTPAKVELGRRLFYDADLSADGTMACATCHEQKHAFAEGNATHPGVSGEPGRRNVPGLANVGWLSPLTFANPRQKTLEMQIAVPVLGTHPVEMGMNGREDEIATRLDRDPCYRAMFARAFPTSGDKIDLALVSKAIASFERTLVSYGSAFDRGRLSPAARTGLALFKRDCAACHAGVNFTDLAYHRFDADDAHRQDQGLAELTGQAGDAARFRTPSLRNVALTGPWWHDGSARSLPEVIRRHGRMYPAAQETQLLAFLDALSDRGFVTDQQYSLPDQECGKRF